MTLFSDDVDPNRFGTKSSKDKLEGQPPINEHIDMGTYTNMIFIKLSNCILCFHPNTRIGFYLSHTTGENGTLEFATKIAVVRFF